jgi:hypothetical protein
MVFPPKPPQATMEHYHVSSQTSQTMSTHPTHTFNIHTILRMHMSVHQINSLLQDFIFLGQGCFLVLVLRSHMGHFLLMAGMKLLGLTTQGANFILVSEMETMEISSKQQSRK